MIILWLVSSRGSQVLGWFAKVSSDNVKLNKVNIQGVDKGLGSWMIGGGVRQDAQFSSIHPTVV